MTDQPNRRLSRALPSGDRLDQPREQRATLLPRVTLSQEAFGVLRGIVDEGLRTGVLRGRDADQVSVAAWSMVHGLGMLIIDGQLGDLAATPAAVRALTDAAGDTLLRGQLA